jgi:N-acetylglucosaminyl-diphospho-decaprenol L-rhamnosyltransferase
MHVVACIVGFRNAADVVETVAALDRSTHPSLSIVICENGGDLAFAALEQAIADRTTHGRAVTRVSAPDNPGYAAGFNRCVRAAPDADAWWLVNPDAQPNPDALSVMLARLQMGDCGLVGGTLYLPDGRVQGHGGRFHGWLARSESIGHGSPAIDMPDDRAVETKMNYVLGASMLVSRRFMEVVGPMREDYFLYAEEIEWCLRGIALGQKLGFAKGARVDHAQGSTTGSGNAIAFRPWLPVYLDERNRLHVVRDTMRARLPVAALMALVFIGLRYARRGAWRQVGFALAGWWAGVCNRRGKPGAVR